MKTKYKVLVILFIVLIISIIFFAVIGGYTSAAYIRANWAEITPRVNGYLKKIYIQNNQFVKVGDPLFSLDRYPFKLAIDKSQADLDYANAQKKLLEDQVKSTQAQVEILKNELNLADVKRKRNQVLSKQNAVSRQEMENTETAYFQTAQSLESFIQSLKIYENQYKAQLSSIEQLIAQLSLAKYNYDESLVLAPFNGYVTNMYLMPGPFVQAGTQLFGIAQTQSCWIEANFKEFWVGRVKPGQKVFISIDSNPFRILHGRVASVTNAVNRLSTPQMVLPYIEPTIDWIRLEYRFTVIIEILDLPKDMHLRMGTDARVFVLF